MCDNLVDNEWKFVKKNIKIHTSNTNITIVPRDEIIKKIKNCKKIYNNNIISIILHGSTGINKHTNHSDIDLAIIWNMPNINNSVYEILHDLQKMLNKKIDIANFVFAPDNKKFNSLIKKYPNGDNNQINYFKDLIKEKGVSIIGNLSDLNLSIYISNIK